jgi:hypothetical protein
MDTGALVPMRVSANEGGVTALAPLDSPFHTRAIAGVLFGSRAVPVIARMLPESVVLTLPGSMLKVAAALGVPVPGNGT